jgi:hypothetical protein
MRLVVKINRCAHAVGASCGELVHSAHVGAGIIQPLGHSRSKLSGGHSDCARELRRRVVLQEFDVIEPMTALVETETCASGSDSASSSSPPKLTNARNVQLTVVLTCVGPDEGGRIRLLAGHTSDHTSRGEMALEGIVRQSPETICGSYDCSSPGLGLCCHNRHRCRCASQAELRDPGNHRPRTSTRVASHWCLPYAAKKYPRGWGARASVPLGRSEF